MEALGKSNYISWLQRQFIPLFSRQHNKQQKKFWHDLKPQNNRLKHFPCRRKRFRHSPYLHFHYFHAVVNITQRVFFVFFIAFSYIFSFTRRILMKSWIIYFEKTREVFTLAFLNHVNEIFISDYMI